MSSTRSWLDRIVDAGLEAPVVTSFTRVGYALRSRLGRWRPLPSYDLRGRVVLLTGATSGLGLSTARQLAGMGATLLLVGRDADKTRRVLGALIEETGNDSLRMLLADMGDLGAVRALAAQVLATEPRLDVLIHNAGALSWRREEVGGIERTVASQVVGPFLLTGLLAPLLRHSAPARVLTMSSGGLYATGLTVEQLEMSEQDYGGAEQYARAKRAQVTLCELWAERFPDSGVSFHALHPGWADTPGVAESLPRFRRVLGPLLRTPEEGADTLVWLAADDEEPLRRNGCFWLDRQVRPIHKLPRTRRTDTPERREALWAYCVSRAGVDPVREG